MPEDQPFKITFDASDIEHKRIGRFQPQFLGIGGEHVVYGLPDYPDYVVKVEGGTLLKFLALETNGVKPTNQEIFERLISEQERIRELRLYFGEEHTLAQSKHFLKIPVNQRILTELEKRYNRNRINSSDLERFTGDEVQTVVSIQERCPGLNDPNKLSLHAGYAEKLKESNSPEFRIPYDRLTRTTIVDLNEEEGPVEPTDLMVVHPEGSEILIKAETDSRLQIALRDFVQRAINYTNNTAETLDLAGIDNVIFYQNTQGDWDYKLIDALYPSPPPEEGRIDEARDIITNVVSSGPNSIAKPYTNILMNALNYTRFINGLASVLEIRDRIDIKPRTDHELDPEDLKRAIKSGLS